MLVLSPQYGLPARQGRGYILSTGEVVYQFRMATRPRTLPARISGASSGRRSIGSIRVILSRTGWGISCARRFQACSRRALGASGELMPSSDTFLRMNGKTVSGRSEPPARPQAATAPKLTVDAITL